ncbi:unnamed protein product [Cochlearia groenlandica]
MKTKTCEICKKPFANGKSLGGYMRSHTQNLSLQSRNSEHGLRSSLYLNQDLSKEIGKRTVVVSDLNKVININETQCCCIQDVDSPNLCLVDMSKRNGLEKSPVKAVSERLISTQKRKHIVVNFDFDDEESYYKYLDQDEDDEYEDVKSPKTSYVRVLTENNDENVENPEDTDDDSSYCVAKEEKCKKLSEYKCDICGKILNSHQALGGHRTSHTYKRLKISDNNDRAMKPPSGTMIRRGFECQICGRVFESGQALGGHKKVHFMFLRP